jgi:hypothetical protein
MNEHVDPDLDLHRAAAALHVPPGDLDTVISRAHQRSARRRRAVAAGTALTMVAAGLGVAWSTRDGGGGRTAIADGGTATRRGDVGVVWERVDARSALGFSPSVDGSSSLFALSTAAGQREFTPQNRVIWRSDDGIEWTAASTLGDDLFLSDLATSGTRIYAVGTGPATASVPGKRPVSDLLVGWSDDGAKSWRHEPLPIDLESIVARSVNAGVGGTHVATSDDATVAIVTLRAEPDVAAMLPDDVTAPHGWALGTDGVDILGDGPACSPGTSPDERVPAPMRGKIREEEPQANSRVHPSTCMGPNGTIEQVPAQQARGVTAHYTWAQLGVEGDFLRAVLGQPIAFRADSGSTSFERVELGLTESTYGVQLVGAPAGFAFVGQVTDAPAQKETPTIVLLRSDDGREWARTPGPSGMAWVSGLGLLNGRTALVGDGDGGPMLAVDNNSGGWSTTPLRDLVDVEDAKHTQISVASAAIGPLGVVAAVSVVNDPIAEAGGIKVTENGYTLHLLDGAWSAVVTDPTGKEIGRTESVFSDAGGPIRTDPSDESITIVDESNGQVVARFSGSAIREQNEALYSRSKDQVRFRLLTSRDGVTWSDEDVNSLADAQSASVLRVLMNGERAVVAVTTGPNRQVALVGTPQ